MFTKKTVTEYFEIIKKNHEDYLNAQMVPHLGLSGTENKKELIDSYLTYIADFRELKKSVLNDDILDSTVADNMKRGGFSALIGMLIGGLFFAAEQQAPSGDLLGIKTAAQAGFATAIGASCAGLIYEIWDNSDEKPAHADFEACKAEMKKAGFTDERYTALSAELVNLFHFRECLLLGLDDKKNVSWRDTFKTQYYSASTLQQFNDAEFNLALEVYFLEQLNTLFKQAFQKIHEIHAKEITEEAENHGFHSWFKRHFESTTHRQKFTQQLQVQFIKHCIHFLEEQINQPGFLGRYVIWMDLAVGFITAALAVTIVAVTTWFIPVFALISIAIAAACLGALAAHLTLTQSDALFYKRSKDNRQAIQVAIDGMDAEQSRLTSILQTVPVTTKKDLSDLKKYDETHRPGFLNIMQKNSTRQVALGSVRAWIREFANRFNESKMVEIDLSDCIKTLVNDAHDQTVRLQNELLSYMKSSQHAPSLANLNHVIRDTMVYLQHPDHADFIKTFETVQKIKEQVLEITGYIPSTHTKPLPEILVEFYTNPIAQGGLGGLISDLLHARRLAPMLSATVQADAKHPYQPLLTTAFTIQQQLNGSPHSDFILQGDIQYRSILGLPCNQPGRIEDQINAANAQEHLNASFDFLCSLNQYETNIDWHGAFQNTDAFIVYRMLLVKQLANLVSPNNPRVPSLVKDMIKRFMRSTLNYNPDVAVDDLLNQALLIHTGTDKSTLVDQLGNPRLVSELAYITDAIRVDIAYVYSELSPEQLIAKEAHQFLVAREDKLIFGYHPISHFTPDPAPSFLQKIKETIQVTTNFLEAITNRTLLEKTHTTTLYSSQVAHQIDQINQQINRLKPSLKDTQILDEAVTALNAFKLTLAVPDEPLPNIAPQPATAWQAVVIPELDAYVSKHSQTAFTFFGAHQTKDKLKAAELLKSALQTGGGRELSTMSNIYTTNPHLKAIIANHSSECSRLGLGP